MENTCRINQQNNCHERPMSTVAAAPTSEVIWDVITRVYGERRHATELLARAAHTTPATAANWLRRKCTPQADNLIALMADCEELKEAVDRLVKERQCSLR